ncbi:hypothetical protein CS063_16380 [Sporanaerobium hydrogeniformans]|uniref:Uncharacterized protein n=1 Tax=Sporanaerobium hydrogeniformans TaxID=3072179 RepID=A0AC61D994_9FIRM|nr:NAD(P)H-dependent oxidoreductase [Sporanaerobium hydrogeniformans]PHV69325.1 hypothetical protein CS063_16380 [Sporanaerobium hydrogeniformans]
MLNIIMDGTKGENSLEAAFKEIASECKEELAYFKLEDFHITPCRNCGGCSYKTPGRCVFKDDTPQLIEVVRQARRCVWITPITLGGYNSITKRLVDKMVLIGVPTMIVYKGRLQHPNSIKEVSDGTYIGVGIVNKDTTEKEKESFKFLIKENGLITCTTGYPLLVEGIEDKEKAKKVLLEALTIGGEK